jgi:hypothetical protein
MRQFQAGVVLCVGLLAGCASAPKPVEPPPRDLTTRAMNDPEEEGTVLLHLAILERPVGDQTLNVDVWAMADEQSLLEQKSTLLANGFRVGLLGGQLPGSLQGLLQSPHSCPTMRQITTHLKAPVPINLGPVRSECRFQVDDGNARTVALKDAQCLLQVVPTLGDDHKLRLRFTPQVKHGKETLAPHPERDVSGSLRWSFDPVTPCEEFSTLAWELVVNPDEYIVIGLARQYTDEPTLGEVCFQGGSPRVQRLVLVRAIRMQTAIPLDEAIAKSPPLALRAVWSSLGGAP